MNILTANYTHPSAPDVFCQSLMNTGFGVLSHHPISSSLIQETYQAWERFFQSDEKYHYLYNRQTQEGYFPFKTENAKNNKISDLKEFYHYYPHGRIPEELRGLTSTLFNALQLLASELLSWIEAALPPEIASQLSMPLHKMINNSTNTLLRILHYPPLASDEVVGAVRSAAHEDINLITLLPAATAPGLEVKDKYGNWHPVSCEMGQIVINVGDMLQRATQHYFISTTHRVINPKTSENISRFSMPLFLHACKEVKIAPHQTAEEYLTERLREIGIY